MNHFHRVIFNPSLGVRQVVSEIASAGRGAGSQTSTDHTARAPRLSMLAAACMLAWCAMPQAQAATCDAVTSAELVTCISGASNGDTINLLGGITLSANLGVIDKNLTINGNGNTLDGASTYRGFFVGGGNVTINDLTMTNLRAKGGDGSGGDGSVAGGGGGMGAGGAVFVRVGAAVTLNNVAINSNSAVGGDGGSPLIGLTNGGGGGMGGNAGMGSSLGPGGGGLFADGKVGAAENEGGAGGGPNGGAGGVVGALHGGNGGDYSGGGGGGGAPGDPPGNGGMGGFGGGGGGGGGTNTSGSGQGGAGGFGGGGGGGGHTGGAGGFGGGGGGGAVRGGAGGFGGGSGQNGGGGAGMGGGVFVMGGASLIITGTLSINGNVVTGGASAVGDAASAGSAFGSGIFLQGTASTLTFAPGAGATQTVGDVITDQTGSGGTGGNAASVGITKADLGTTILSGDNSYTGGTTISAGTLQLGNGGASGSITGNVLNNGVMAFNRSDNLTFSGVISGLGDIRQSGTGTVALSGANTYSGYTYLDAGVLSVASDENLGDTSTVLVFNGGTLQNTAAFTMERNINTSSAGGTFQTDADLTVGSSFSIPILTKSGTATLILTSNVVGGSTTISAGTLQLGDGGGSGSITGNVTNNGTLAFKRNNTLDFSGVISGNGNVRQDGAGTVTLTGNNTYSGGTIISAGTLQLGNGGASGSITGDVANNGTLAFNRNNALAFSGVISGSGNVRHSGTGTVTLSGANTYMGGTNLDAGTLSVAADNNLGDAAGALTFNGGTLQNTAVLNTARAVHLTGNGAFQTDANLAATGPIDGTGGLTKTGAGTLLLTGNNTYGGSTTVSAGTLQVGNGGTTGSLGTGVVTNNAALVFNRSDAITATNDISGTGSLDKQGAGTLILSGTNTYSGATTVSTGTLQIGNGGTTGSLGTGAVTNNAALTFNRSDAYTAANPISGTGTLTQNGAGNLILTGTNTYSGATTVNAGTLSVNGSITSATTINSGGTLGGNGTVGNVTVTSGGILAPGNSIGTLTVNGNLTFAPGSVYRVETDAAGNADRVNVVGAPGTLTINGGTVDVQAGAGTYARNTSYTILTSTGATAGTFTGVTSNLAFLTPSLSYLPNGVMLNLLAENAPAYSTVAQTPNQVSVANYLGSFANTPGSAAAAALIQQIDNLSAEQARVAFDSMSGSPHSTASQIAGAIGRNFSATLATRTGFGLGSPGTSASSTAGLKALKFASVSPALMTRPGDVVSDSPLRVSAADPSGESQERPTLQSVGGLWGQAMGTGGRIGSDGNGPASRYRANGFVLGYDQPITSNWLAGAALAYTRTQWDANTRGIAPASGRIGTPQAGLYARYASGPWQVRLDGTYSDHRFSTDRTVTIGNANSIARSSHGGTEWAFAAQAEYSLPSGDWDIRPLAGLRHARLSEDGFTETGAGAASLTVDARRSQNTVASLGMKFIRPLSSNKADTGSLELRAVASHLMGDNDSPIRSGLAGQPGSFTAAGTPLKRTALTLGGTLTGQLSRGLSTYVDAAYEYRGSGQNAFQLVAGLRLAW